LDFLKVKEHAQEFVTILSNNDTFVSRQLSEELAGKLSARVIVENKKGHFLSNVKELDSVLNTILEMEQMKVEKKEISNFRKFKLKSKKG
jgi:predicted alpha/beta hydrolase family esterase